jgi:hypothetical protein
MDVSRMNHGRVAGDKTFGSFDEVDEMAGCGM